MSNEKKSWLSQTLVGLGLTSLFNDFSHEMTTAILPAFIQQIVSGSEAALIVGIISGVSDAATSIFKIISGVITDRIKRYKPLLIIGYGITPLFIGLIGTACTTFQILTYKTIAWTGRGLREPIRDTWLSYIVSSTYYGRAFGFQRAADTIGAILGPLTAFIALKYVTIRTIFFISLIPGAISLIVLILLTKQEELPQFKNPYKNIFDQFRQLPLPFNYFTFVMFIFGIGNFNKLLIIYRAQERIFGEAHSFITATAWAILLYTLFNCIRALSEFGFGTLSDFYSRTYILSFIGFGSFGVANCLLMSSSDSLLLWALIFILAGMSTGAVTAVEKAYAGQLLPEHIRGTGFGLLQMVDGVGDLASSIIVGALWRYICPNAGFIYAASLSFIAMIMLMIKKDGRHIKQ
ncbi:MAG TPA: MFS transporter [Candidatus Babeliales bacterium]|nr:MFS transporter [Candidatus Babeliales bacterium]